MSRIFLVSYGGGHVAALAPVARKLKELGHNVIFLALTTAQSFLDRQKIPYIGFKDFPESQAYEVQVYGKNLAKTLSSQIVSLEESIAYLGLCYKELVANHGKQASKELYELHGRQAFLPIKTLKNAMIRIQPELVLTTNSPRAERAAILASGQLGIPSICLVDLFAFQEIQWIGKPNYASKLCVLNEEVKKRFVEHGRHPNEVVVTGNPAFDQLQSTETQNLGLELKKKRGWDDGCVNILWASHNEPKLHPFNDLQGNPDLPYEIESVLRKFIKEHKNFRLIIRYHPSQSVSFLEQDRVFLSSKQENLHELLYAVDIVIVMSSTVGLEASLVQKTVISVDSSIFFEDAPYSRMGISHGVSSPQALPNAILKICSNKVFDHKNPIIEQNCSSTSSTIEVVSVIESLLGDIRKSS